MIYLFGILNTHHLESCRLKSTLYLLYILKSPVMLGKELSRVQLHWTHTIFLRMKIIKSEKTNEFCYIETSNIKRFLILFLTICSIIDHICCKISCDYSRCFPWLIIGLYTRVLYFISNLLITFNVIDSHLTASPIISYSPISSLFQNTHTKTIMADGIEIACNITINLVYFDCILALISFTIKNVLIHNTLCYFIHWSHIRSSVLLNKQICNICLWKSINVSQTDHWKVVLSPKNVLAEHDHAITCEMRCLLRQQYTCIQLDAHTLLVAPRVPGWYIQQHTLWALVSNQIVAWFGWNQVDCTDLSDRRIDGHNRAAESLCIPAEFELAFGCDVENEKPFT